jgi:CRP-like cAMP-binding protein
LGAGADERLNSLEMVMKTNAGPPFRRVPQNRLLAALPSAERARFSNDLELVPLKLGEVLYESGETMTHAYFPTDCVISLLYVMKNGESAEIAIVGNEGMIGVALFMGGDSTMSRAIVQNAGQAFRLKAKVLKDEFNRGNELTHSLLIFGSALITQMVQTAACNRHHTVDQQLCRWMLLSLDRLPTGRISMTPKLIGNMLGLKAPDVKSATDVLNKAGLIYYDDGDITVLDRKAVERRSCECYGVVKKESDRLLALQAKGEVVSKGNVDIADQPRSVHYTSPRRKPDDDFIRAYQRLNAFLDAEEFESAIHRIRIETLSWFADPVCRTVAANDPFRHTRLIRK